MRRFLMLLSAELIRAAANLDGPTPADAPLSAVADVLGEITDTKKV